MNLDAEDQKLVTLARGARGRVSADTGACVRDQDGRTYSAASVVLGDKSFGALELAVAIAAASGAKSLEAGCTVGSEPSTIDVEVFRVLAQSNAPLIQANAAGEVTSA